MPIGAAVQKTEHPVGRDRHKGGLPSGARFFHVGAFSAVLCGRAGTAPAGRR